TGTITYGQGAPIQYEGETLSVREQSLVRSLANQSSHPVSRQIEVAYRKAPLLPVTEFEAAEGQGIRGVVDGHKVMIGSRQYVASGADHLAEGTWIRIDNQMRGRIIQSGRYRNGLREVIGNFRNRFKLSLLTGDQDRERRSLEQLFGNQAILRFNQSP